ncbi:putative N-acetylmannosamine-6-phosphate 2-epimerase [Litoreibacter sp.]|nr:putative N-acetylmannosamine-6-phosphate 2-epimerase [Litoreibacter sp.]
MNKKLEQLRYGLIASCQPVDDGPMDRPDIVAAMARAAVAGGALGLRIEGVENLAAARAAVDVPIIGIVKSDSPDTPVRITVSVDDVTGLVAAGADIVAYDATDRPRLHGRDDILKAILDAGAIAMADCSTLEDGIRAQAHGAAILGTTLSGYTDDTAQLGSEPDLKLVRAFRRLGGFVMAEGRYDAPEMSAEAIRAGADAITVGSSLTRLEVVTARFASAILSAKQESQLTGFAVDLGGTKTAAAYINAGKVVRRIERPTVGDAEPDAQVRLIAELLEELEYQTGDPLGVAVTGRIDAEGNWYAVNQNTLAKVTSVPLTQLLIAKVGPASVINDAAAATLAEHRLGSGRQHTNFAFITVSTGIGGGLVLNGQLHQSPNGLAGHIGFTSTPRGNVICGSGRFGTIESMASGRAIARAASDAGHQDMDARAVFEAANLGAPWAKTVVENSGHAVAEMAADLVVTLGVTRIALGGSIGLADGYLECVDGYLSTLPPLFSVDLIAAELGRDAPLFGVLLSMNKRLRR